MLDNDTAAIIELNLPPDLHRFVRLVLDRADLQARLGAEIESNAFVAAALLIAQENGVELGEASLRAVLRPDPIGVGRFAPPPLAMAGWPPQGWLPTRSVPTGGAPAFDWMWFGNAPLTQPFFEDEVRRASALPLNWLLRIRTGLAELVAGAGSQDSLPLQGLVFHMSRCGSTLVAQMLAAVPGHAVSSEPEPLDAVLRWSAESGASVDEAIMAIRAMVAALGRVRYPGGQRHFIKLEVWHTLFLPLLRQAFPATNWVYLHREPAEVLVSVREMPSHHIVPGVIPAGYFGEAQLPDLSLEEFAAFVLSRCSGAVVQHWPLGGGMVLEYPAIRSTVPTALADHFGLDLTPQERLAMEQAGSRDAKNPGKPFADDTQRKRAAAGPETLAVAAHWLAPVRARLMALADVKSAPK